LAFQFTIFVLAKVVCFFCFGIVFGFFFLIFGFCYRFFFLFWTDRSWQLPSLTHPVRGNLLRGGLVGVGGGLVFEVEVRRIQMEWMAYVPAYRYRCNGLFIVCGRVKAHTV